MKADSAANGAGLQGRLILAFVLGQVGIHACMAGVRMAAPLQLLREGHGTWAVGGLLALYAAAPVALAMSAGRMADRHGYHRPVRLAAMLAIAGGLLALCSSFAGGLWHLAWLVGSALLLGSSANLGMIAIQRTAGHAASTATERVRVFSWLGVAPPFANVVGPVTAGLLIDAGGFAVAYAAMATLPLLTLWMTLRVPRQAPQDSPGSVQPQPAWDLLRAPGMRRLMVVNWLLSTAWDVHTFAVPILGHQHGFSASTIGLVLGVFTAAVALVRLLVPFLAHRVERSKVLAVAMLATAAVMAAYPFAANPLAMMVCAVCMGLALGSVQPMIMSTLHDLTPHHRHGQAIALRSMVMNASSTAMPLLFGATGAVLGAGVLFWLCAAALGWGSTAARGLEQPAAKT